MVFRLLLLSFLIPLLQNREAEAVRVRFEIVFDNEDPPGRETLVFDIKPQWAPKGAARFLELVNAGFYSECRFFRVIRDFVAQFGINGDPAVSAHWGQRRIDDDPPQVTNGRGTLSFAMSGANSRTTQLFINFKDNSYLDNMGFAPLGRVVEGEGGGDALLDRIYAGYGEGAPKGGGPEQGKIQSLGNAYLAKSFPLLTYIASARVEEEAAAAAGATAADVVPPLRPASVGVPEDPDDEAGGDVAAAAAGERPLVVKLFVFLLVLAVLGYAGRLMTAGRRQQRPLPLHRPPGAVAGSAGWWRRWVASAERPA